MGLGLLLGLSPMPCAAQDGGIRCCVEGSVAGNDSCVLLIMPDGATDRTGRSDTIPVVGGRFFYEFSVGEPAVYSIRQYASNGACNAAACFFAVDDTIRVTFHRMADERQPTVSCASPLNLELQRADSTLEAARRETRKRYSDSVGYYGSSEYRQFSRDCQNMAYRYAESHPTLVGLHFLKSLTMDHRLDTALANGRIEALFAEKYATRYPRHKMSKSIRHWIASRNLRVGGRYVDFYAPDKDGVWHTLSEEIEGRYALIDLWASWCGPCVEASRSMIPVYEKYKDRGFTIVGVAREKSVGSFVRELGRGKYPWLNLVDVNDEGAVWERYGKIYVAGGTYLVDRDGIILAVDPTAEEVEAILREVL